VSLRTRLTVGTVSLLSLAIAGAFLAGYLVVRGQLRGQIDQALRERTAGFVRPRAPSPKQVPRFLQPRRATPGVLGQPVGYIQLVSSAGTVTLLPGEHVRLPVDAAADVAAGRRTAFFRDATVNGTHVRIYTVRVRRGTAVEIARPLTEVDRALDRIRLLFLGVAGLVVLLGAGAGLLFARQTLQPVRRLTDDAERIAGTGDLQARTDASRADELGRLALAFNTMLDALAQSVTAQRQLVADASHELRTPLTTARTNLEVLQLHDLSAVQRVRILAEAIDELKELGTLVDALVELARGDVRPPLLAPLRLDVIVDDAVAVAARRSGRDFRLDVEATWINGAADSLTRAVSNLLDNAAKWSSPPAAIDVTVRDGVVRIRDRGSGISDDDLPYVFDRFYRAASARTMPGSGLGLAIVRQVVEFHGGTASVERPPGGGVAFVLRLPTLERGTAAETTVPRRNPHDVTVTVESA
jgi:two-component system sensor histidine kinase MprB